MILDMDCPFKRTLADQFISSPPRNRLPTAIVHKSRNPSKHLVELTLKGDDSDPQILHFQDFNSAVIVATEWLRNRFQVIICP